MSPIPELGGSRSSRPGSHRPDTMAPLVEVYDEANETVMTFTALVDAELYGLTGEPTWVSVRAARSARGQNTHLTLAAVLGS